MHVPERLEQGGSLHGDFHRNIPILERLGRGARRRDFARPILKIRGETGPPVARPASRGADSAKARRDAQGRSGASVKFLAKFRRLEPAIGQA